MKCFFILFFLKFNFLYADTEGFLGEGFLPKLPDKSAPHYISPNEKYPQDMTGILAQSNGGAYISVGTERSFIGFAMSNATHLVAIDLDEQVNKFNQINR